MNHTKFTEEYFKKEGFIIYPKGSWEQKDFGDFRGWKIKMMGSLCEIYYRDDIGAMMITRKAGHVTVFNGYCENEEDFKTIQRLCQINPYYKYKESIPND